ncbi:GDSL-type esterase/lipase family protein [Streptomyces sp. NPDC051940]|uniref:GDSL-type esterase/lipase family protein n=1 Tax=Streptomyces sp. NPDC051940 TaxID=3155675 RepID=UPI0034352296
MVVGDSISHGSTGDYTWRYRFWRHLREQRVAVDFVGPKKSLDTVATHTMGDEDLRYADPGFDRDHACQWGLTYADAKNEIADLVLTYRPDYVLVLLGIDDIVWNDTRPPGFEANLREFLTAARRGRTDVRLVIGTILDTNRAHEDVGFARRVFQCNEVIRDVCSELDDETSPVAVADTCREFFAPDHTWDGTHPNPRGELRVAAAFADMLALRFGVGRAFRRPLPDVGDVAAELKRDAVPELRLERSKGGWYSIREKGEQTP